MVRLRDLVNVVYTTVNGTRSPLELTDSFYDLRDTVGVVELLILRILNFRVPQPNFFNFIAHYLYAIEKVKKKHNFPQMAISFFSGFTAIRRKTTATKSFFFKQFRVLQVYLINRTLILVQIE